MPALTATSELRLFCDLHKKVAIKPQYYSRTLFNLQINSQKEKRYLFLNNYTVVYIVSIKHCPFL